MQNVHKHLNGGSVLKPKCSARNSWLVVGAQNTAFAHRLVAMACACVHFSLTHWPLVSSNSTLQISGFGKREIGVVVNRRIILCTKLHKHIGTHLPKQPRVYKSTAVHTFSFILSNSIEEQRTLLPCRNFQSSNYMIISSLHTPSISPINYIGDH